jgi:peptidoglycan/LPS O-acetylase OafA/YrhL
MKSSTVMLDLEKADGESIELGYLESRLGESLPKYSLTNHDIQYPLRETSMQYQLLETTLTEAQPAEPIPIQINSSDQKSIAYLHGLRGLCAAVVYNFHHIAFWYGYPNDLVYQLGNKNKFHILQLPFIRWMWTGVNLSIFFFLSGYVLSISNLRKLRNNDNRYDCYQSLVSAVIRRPFRLFIPTLGISLIVALSLHLPSGFHPVLPKPQESLFAELKEFLLESLTLMNPFVKHGNSVNWYMYDIPAWTMPVELIGSMVVYFFIALSSLAPRQYEIVLFSITGLVFFFTNQWHVASFCGGVVLAINDLDGFDHRVLHHVSQRTRTIFYNTVLVIGLWLLSQPHPPLDPDAVIGSLGWKLLFDLIPSNYANTEPVRFYDTIGSFMCLYALLRLRWMQRIFSSRLFLFLGYHCVSIYITHAPYGFLFGDRIQRLFGVIKSPEITTVFDNLLPLPDYGPVGLSSNYLLAQSIMLPGNLAVAWLATKYLDRPSISIGRWIVHRLGQYFKILRNKDWEANWHG